MGCNPTFTAYRGCPRPGRDSGRQAHMTHAGVTARDTNKAIPTKRGGERHKRNLASFMIVGRQGCHAISTAFSPLPTGPLDYC